MERPPSEAVEIPMPEAVTAGPPSAREILSVHALKFMHEDTRVPDGAKKLFWGFFTKFGALSNLREDDVDSLILEYDYCCILYLMSRRRATAKERADPLKIIENQFNEMMFLAEGRSFCRLQLRRSIGALNLQLMAPRTMPAAAQTPEAKRGFLGRLLGR